MHQARRGLVAREVPQDRGEGALAAGAQDAAVRRDEAGRGVGGGVVLVPQGDGLGGVVDAPEDGDVDARQGRGRLRAGVGRRGPSCARHLDVGPEVEDVRDAEGLQGRDGAGGRRGGAVEQPWPCGSGVRRRGRGRGRGCAARRRDGDVADVAEVGEDGLVFCEAYHGLGGARGCNGTVFFGVCVCVWTVGAEEGLNFIFIYFS